MENQTIESYVADTVLERPTDVLTIEGVEYKLAPPTLATIIMTSELVAKLPQFESSNDDLLYEVMKNARNCKTIGKIAAVLLLGAKRVLENRRIAVPHEGGKCCLIPRCFRRHKTDKTIAEVDHLAQTILNEVSPATLQTILMKRLIDMQIGDFFGITTSLTTANHLKATKEVENQTAYGE